MNILIVGNVIKDVYLNLDTRTEVFETDKHGTKWLNLAFDNSDHRFYNQSTSLGGAAVTLEVLTNLGLSAKIIDSELSFDGEDEPSTPPAVLSRFILIAEGSISYLSPSKAKSTIFNTPSESYDYLYIDRSARLDQSSLTAITDYLASSPTTKLIIYLKRLDDDKLTQLLPKANLVFYESPAAPTQPPLSTLDPSILVGISESNLQYLDIGETISIDRVNMLTHLSAYSIASATILGAFIRGYSVEESLSLAKANVENSRLNSTLTLQKLSDIAHQTNHSNLTHLASLLVAPAKGILAADESGGSIHRKFLQLNIHDTYNNRRDYRNIFFTTPKLEDYVNGVILFEETAEQIAENGQNFVDYLIDKGIIPGIKVDQGLESFSASMPPSTVASDKPTQPEETWAKGLSGLSERLKNYYQMGLRFAKWRTAFEIHFDQEANLLTPSEGAIETNCSILAEYAKECQVNNLVPIVEPEVVHDGNYSIEQCANVTGHILDTLFDKLKLSGVDFSACILKVNMILAGKQFEHQSTPEEVGRATAEVLKTHVPENLAGVVFLSGGQTAEQATDNLKAIIAQGPYPWPVTFSFARALQDPALYSWAGNNANADSARSAFRERLIANTDALKSSIYTS